MEHEMNKLLDQLEAKLATVTTKPALMEPPCHSPLANH